MLKRIKVLPQNFILYLIKMYQFVHFISMCPQNAIQSCSVFEVISAVHDIQ